MGFNNALDSCYAPPYNLKLPRVTIYTQVQKKQTVFHSTLSLEDIKFPFNCHVSLGK